jgi:hypothetical protein
LEPPAAQRRSLSSKPAEIPLAPADGPPEKVWDDYFRQNSPDPLAVCELVLRLQRAKNGESLVACLNAAIIHGQAQPWMYTVLALELEQLGSPREEIERALLSTVDFSAVNVANSLYSAAFLTRFGAKDRALAMYRQASAVDPTRLEPYVMGLKLAGEAKDADAVAWAAAGILQRAWNSGYEALHRDAEEVARQMEATLREQGHDDDADRLARSIAEARVCDLVIEVSWSGKADLDLLVEEPGGAVCSADNPTTTGGGIFTHDGFGVDPKDAHDNYVCPRGMSGDYRVTVRHILGEVVGKRAVLKITRYRGTAREIEERFTIKLSDQDKVVRVTLTNGRLKEQMAMQWLDIPRDQPGAAGNRRRERFVGSREGRRAGARFVEDRQRGGGGRGAPGYQPVITVLSEGVMMTTMALVSGDRRYVRLTVVPQFSTITDVQSFSFISASGSNPNNPGQSGGGGTGGGRTGP